MPASTVSVKSEQYEITKTRLNPGVFNYIVGIFWPNSYLYTMPRAYARLPENKLFFSREQWPTGPSWGYTSDDSRIPGQITLIKLINDSFSSDHGININAIDASTAYNFVERDIQDKLYYMVPDMNSLKVNTDASITGAPTISAVAKWRSNVGEGSLLNQSGISVIKTSYYNDEGMEDTRLGSSRLENYIKLVYNTSDPATVGYNGGDGVITNRYSAGFITIAYDSESQEIEKLQEQFGTPVISSTDYSANVYNEEISFLSKEIYLTQAKKRRIFLRIDQPNELRINELLKVSNYVEYNTKLVSLIASPSAMSIMSDSPGAY